jgi:hypothetical protein
MGAVDFDKIEFRNGMLTLLIVLKIVSLFRKKTFNLKRLTQLFPKRLSHEKVSPPPALLGIALHRT